MLQKATLSRKHNKNRATPNRLNSQTSKIRINPNSSSNWVQFNNKNNINRNKK